MVITHVIHFWGQDHPKHPKPTSISSQLGGLSVLMPNKGTRGTQTRCQALFKQDPCRRGPLTFWRPQLGEIPGCPVLFVVYFSPKKSSNSRYKRFSLQGVVGLQFSWQFQCKRHYAWLLHVLLWILAMFAKRPIKIPAMGAAWGVHT
jgi:hypothetical protein